MSALLLLILVALLVSGGSGLANLGRGLGRGVRAFRKTMQDSETEPVPPKRVVVEPVAPKLLPAKGESSSEVVPPDSERS
ncbi:MAG: twin-arginine translocase TatA/TatE family subunit [Polyangiaceae bacterium]